MKSGHAPSPACGPEALLNARAWRAKKIPGARLRTAATLLVLATVAVAFLQYDGAGTFLTGAWIVAPSMPEWQQMPDAMPGYAFAQDQGPLPVGAFATTWNVTASPHTINIPVEVHPGGTLSIDWGDNSTDMADTNSTISHTYTASGEYQVSMTGNLSRINLAGSNSTASNLVSIDQWGNIEWSTMKGAFHGASNMKYNAADAPDLSDVTNMNHMFEGASSFDGNISAWNVSKVTSMDAMFNGASSFNGDISGWDVSKVTSMDAMFNDATDFNQPLNGWNVSSVENMSFMFTRASSFNGNISAWNVSSVTNMLSMFDGATAFNQPLDSWNVSKVTSMSFMFNGASAFNQPLDSWNVSKVTSMLSMFMPLDSWNVSS